MPVNFFLIYISPFFILPLCQQQTEVTMTQTTIKQVKRGELFSLIDDDNSPLWVRYDYSSAYKQFICYRYDDVNHISFFKSNRVVFI